MYCGDIVNNEVMKANELMIGDWVRDHTSINRRIICLKRFPDGKEMVVLENGVELSIEKCTPVPLRKQYLEYNEFQILDGINWWKDGFYFPSEDYVRTPTFCGCEIRRFIYVHELQNALRMCGLNELADNFIV